MHMACVPSTAFPIITRKHLRRSLDNNSTTYFAYLAYFAYFAHFTYLLTYLLTSLKEYGAKADRQCVTRSTVLCSSVTLSMIL